MAVFNLNNRRTRRLWFALSSVTAAMLFAFGMVLGAGAVTGSPSGFESSDGDMVLTTTTGTNTDWNCFVGSDNFQTGTPNTNCKVKTGAAHITADTNGEITWVNGQKFDTRCPALQTGSVPNKDDFTDIAEYQEFASNGDLYFYGGAIRSTANGNASGDVEFNQLTGQTAPDQTTSAGCRTANDRLIAYEFLNGGTSLDFHVLTWIDPSNLTAGGNTGKCFVKTDSPSPNGCWGANVLTVSASLFDGQANQAAITAGNNGISGAALAIQQFAEFGINLTQALGGGALPCFPQQVWESRSSGSSFTSNPEDIEFANLSTCGKLTIIKHTSPRGLDQSFSYTSPGLSPTSFSLNDKGNTTGDSAGNTRTFSSVNPGTYTITEGAEPAGFAFGSITCVKASGTTAGSWTYDTANQAVAVTIEPNADITCTYVNNQQKGALMISKASVKSTSTSPVPLQGAVFTIKDPSGTAITGSPFTTNSSGVICVDGLTTLGNYTVQETGAPTGYAIDDGTAHTVSVTATNAKCTDTTFGGGTISFTDSPLVDLTVHVASEVAGAAESNIQCVDSSNNAIGNSPQPASNAGQLQFSDPVTLNADPTHGAALKPGTYTCTITVDP